MFYVQPSRVFSRIAILVPMIVTLTGENEVGRQKELHRITTAFVTEHGDMGLERIDGEEAGYGQMLGAVQSLPFLAARKLVILRGPSANKEFVEKFEQFLGEVAETNDVVLVEAKLDKRLAYYKALQKRTDFKEFTIMDTNALVRFLTDYAQQAGGEMAAPTARWLIDRVGTNQLSLQHEVDKLLAYNPKIDRASVELLTDKTPQSSIFDVLDAAFAGNSSLAFQRYKEQRALRVEPRQIIAMLAWQLYILALVKTAKDRSADQIARDSHMKPFVIRKTQNLARHVSMQQLRKYIAELHHFDVRLKTESLLADEVVQYYLLTLTT